MEVYDSDSESIISYTSNGINRKKNMVANNEDKISNFSESSSSSSTSSYSSLRLTSRAKELNYLHNNNHNGNEVEFDNKIKPHKILPKSKKINKITKRGKRKHKSSENNIEKYDKSLYDHDDDDDHDDEDEDEEEEDDFHYDYDDDHESQDNDYDKKYMFDFREEVKDRRRKETLKGIPAKILSIINMRDIICDRNEFMKISSLIKFHEYPLGSMNLRNYMRDMGNIFVQIAAVSKIKSNQEQFKQIPGYERVKSNYLPTIIKNLTLSILKNSTYFQMKKEIQELKDSLHNSIDDNKPFLQSLVDEKNHDFDLNLLIVIKYLECLIKEKYSDEIFTKLFYAILK